VSSTVNVGVIGVGNAGVHHATSFAGCTNAKVVAAADPSAEALDKISGTIEGIVGVTDYHQMLAMDEVDLVMIATPHNLHKQMVVDALQAGKNVLCEKPLAMTIAECDEMIATAKQTGSRLFVIQTHRTNPPFLRLKRIVEENDMGKPIGGLVQYLGCEVQRMSDETSWKGTHEHAGGGVLLDGGVHAIDLCNWYFGKPVAVSAQCHSPEGWSPQKGETTGSVLITYESGTIAQVFATFEARLRGSFSEGTLRMSADLFYEEGSARAESAYYGKFGPTRSVSYVCRSDEEHVVEPTAEDEINYSQHVIDCILNGTEPLVGPQDARAAVAVAETAYKSAATGQQVSINL